jgi:hypothetical protein
MAEAFEELARMVEQAIEQLAHDESGAVNLWSLHNAKDLARHGAQLTRNAARDLQRTVD